MRRQLEPGPDHPIEITLKQTPVQFILAGNAILSADAHFELCEARYPPAIYLPREGISLAALERSTHTSWCPYKGEAAYYHIRPASGARIENAIWTYENPFPAVREIKDALAVYASKIDEIRIGSPSNSEEK
ncbi:MAG: DUF427 domain-containing protein [Pseudomonadota bacterium]